MLFSDFILSYIILFYYDKQFFFQHLDFVMIPSLIDFSLFSPISSSYAKYLFQISFSFIYNLIPGWFWFPRGGGGSVESSAR